MSSAVEEFIAKWSASGAAERANKDLFLAELCDLLGVPRPNPATGDPAKDTYVFERGVRFVAEGGTSPQGRIDLYKEGCFILEAKQGAPAGSKKTGTAKRGTPGWTVAMGEAYGQALGYAKTFERPPPFLVVCDLGHCFDLYAVFDGSWNYRQFPGPQSSRIFLADLGKSPKHLETLRQIFLDPLSLDPARKAAEVTREVAKHLAELARRLEAAKHPPELIATFLMRCLFTMFAEDVNLLPEQVLTSMIEQRWLPKPHLFPAGIEALWRLMNEGGENFQLGRVLRFNGGLFASPAALPLDKEALGVLLEAAKCDWSNVEPSIFGTLLERALDPKERHRLGAHYTPRAYVERLVRPTIEEPLRAEWDVVQAEVRELVKKAGEEPVKPALTEAEYLAKGPGAKARQAAMKDYEKAVKQRKAKLDEARRLLHGFHERLTKIRILDPACGSGNFLYVALDLMKRLEGEVLGALQDLGVRQELLAADALRVMPGQFLGIEVKRWAKEIAELVLWIGYLQWHFRTYGKGAPIPEPVLRDFKNIEHRDAVLAWDKMELRRDKKGKPIGRWDGETMKKSPVTGEDIPDEKAQVPAYEYINPRKAKWPKADFIVGNPPYIGVRVMRETLDPEYVETLRAVYQEVPETSDLVMYWWHKAALEVESGRTLRFGLITTDKLSDAYSRRIVEHHLHTKTSIRIIFAIDKHPWPNDPTSAAVRVAMTVAESAKGSAQPWIGSVLDDQGMTDAAVMRRAVPAISATLKADFGAKPRAALKSNSQLCFQGVVPANEGFKLTADDLRRLKYDPTRLPPTIKRYIIGKDLVGKSANRFIIDFFGIDQDTAKKRWPDLFQILIDRVLPERKHNPRKSYRDRWWLFAESRPAMRRALYGLPRFIATPYTAVHRPFVFVPGDTLPDAMAYAVADSDAYVLGVLSSKIHHCFALDAGSALEDRPRYNSKSTFFPFPFPCCAKKQQTKIRTIAESLDAHRKARQAAHPDLTITGMYNVLEKLRSGEPLTDKEKTIHQQGLVSVLKQIHDDLDAAVFDAYGWPADLTDEQILEKLVALNAERAEEEKTGLVRWLRPDFQNPAGARPATQQALAGTAASEEEETEAPPPTAKPWPKKIAEQIVAVRDCVTDNARAWSLDDLSAAFSKAPPEEIEIILDSLAGLGLLVRFDTGGITRWKLAGKGA